MYTVQLPWCGQTPHVLGQTSCLAQSGALAFLFGIVFLLVEMRRSPSSSQPPSNFVPNLFSYDPAGARPQDDVDEEWRSDACSPMADWYSQLARSSVVCL